MVWGITDSPPNLPINIIVYYIPQETSITFPYKDIMTKGGQYLSLEIHTAQK